MDPRKLALPAMVLIGGALFGRLVTVRTLMRVAMAGLTLAQAANQSGLLEAPRNARSRGKAVQRPARRRPAQKKSRPV